MEIPRAQRVSQGRSDRGDHGQVHELAERARQRPLPHQHRLLRQPPQPVHHARARPQPRVPAHKANDLAGEDLVDLHGAVGVQLDQGTLVIEPHAHETRPAPATRMNRPHIQAARRPRARRCGPDGLRAVCHLLFEAQIAPPFERDLAEVAGRVTRWEGLAGVGAAPHILHRHQTIPVPGAARRLLPALPRLRERAVTLLERRGARLVGRLDAARPHVGPLARIRAREDVSAVSEKARDNQQPHDEGPQPLRHA